MVSESWGSSSMPLPTSRRKWFATGWHLRLQLSRYRQRHTQKPQGYKSMRSSRTFSSRLEDSRTTATVDSQYNQHRSWSRYKKSLSRPAPTYLSCLYLTIFFILTWTHGNYNPYRQRIFSSCHHTFTLLFWLTATPTTWFQLRRIYQEHGIVQKI